MDFGIGYRWRSYESNLLLAVRLASDEFGRRRRGSGPIGRTGTAETAARARAASAGSDRTVAPLLLVFALKRIPCGRLHQRTP